MGRSQTTFQKRQREQRKIRQREAKAEKARRRREQQDADRDALVEAGVDPDLEGIAPGAHNNEPLIDDDFELQMDGVGGVLLVPKKKPAP